MGVVVWRWLAVMVLVTMWSMELFHGTQIHDLNLDADILGFPQSEILLSHKKKLWIRLNTTHNRAIASMEDHRHYIRVLPDITSVIIDVGTNANPYYLDQATKNPHLFYVAIEPQPMIYATMASVVQNTSTKSRSITINAAAALKEGFTIFYISSNSECSSLLPANKARQHECHLTATKTSVPTIRLDTLISFFPPRLRFRILAIDAQGFDFVVLQSAHQSRDRLDHVILECQDYPESHPKLLRQGAYTCGIIIKCMPIVMPNMDLVRCVPNNFDLRELNCLFANKESSAGQATLRMKNDFWSKEQAREFFPHCPKKFPGQDKRDNCRGAILIWSKPSQTKFPTESCLK
jgi:FkbM family methyltransferase